MSNDAACNSILSGVTPCFRKTTVCGTSETDFKFHNFEKK